MKSMKYLLILTISLFTFAHENCDGESDLKNCSPDINDQSRIESFEDSIKTSVDHLISHKACTHYSKFVKLGLPKDLIKQALNFYINNQDKFKNKRYISIADYSQNSRNRRYYLLDLITGDAKSYHVSHGSGKVDGITYGDPNHDGMIDSCKFTTSQLEKINKNRPAASKIHDRWAMTRPGFFSTANLANSTAHDPEIRPKGAWPMISTTPRINKLVLKGLSSGVNDDALRNGVVMHEAWYNTADIMGRSFGCPAFRPEEGREIMNKILGGSLFYAYVPKCNDDMDKVLNQVKNWERTCSK